MEEDCMRVMAALLVAGVIGACSSGYSGGSYSTTSGPGGPVTINTVNMTFDPAPITISAGTTVHWMNSGPLAHTVTSGTGSADANAGAMFDQALGSGGSFDFTFATAGTYPYFCRPHEAMNMRGTITVTGTSTGGGGSGGGGSGGGGGGYTH
jgi:plastocyanin